MNYLVTGAAGFIGFHLCRRLLADAHTVIGVDNLNNYYDATLKEARLQQIRNIPNFCFKKLDIADEVALKRLFQEDRFDIVIHLAAQAGVRYSIDNPHSYLNSNLVGFFNILEMCRNSPIKHLLFASSSSVYGMNKKIPFSEDDRTDFPVSLYAATKKSNELLAYSYSHLYQIPMTGLRFFTVYGPWGRPDMAYFSFSKAILGRKTIRLFNNGDMYRDFTYIDDIVEGILLLLDKSRALQKEPPFEVYNIGNNQPEKLEYFISCLEESLGTRALKEYCPMQLGDVYRTYADVSKLQADTGFHPSTPLKTGLDRFAQWFKLWSECT